MPASGRYHDAVIRSLITLKALTYGPTGGIVAAPTTSLPEWIGGVRNWDYRFCWLRDATLTLLALMNAGHYDEAEAWREWLVRAVAGRPEQAQIMYGIAGERRLDEWQVPWLPGFRDSAPVRVGNGAYGQLQLDVFGEVMDALHTARRGGLAPSDTGWAVQVALIAAFGAGLANARPRHLGGAERAAAFHLFQGHGLGGLRSRHQERRDFKLEGPVEHWRQLRAQIHDEVCRPGFDPAQQLRAVLRQPGARREPPVAAGGRLSAAAGPARERHGRSDRAQA